MPNSFVHLRIHSEYSLVDGLVRIKPLVSPTAAMGMPALALTDHCNMFAMVKFQRAAIGAGLKPIFGADIYLESTQDDEAPSQIVLLAKSLQGYRNLTELVSGAFLHGQSHDRAVVPRALLAEKSAGLICLSGGKGAEIGRALVAGKRDKAIALAGEYMEWFLETKTRKEIARRRESSLQNANSYTFV